MSKTLKQKHSLPYDFIVKDEHDPINVQYWKEKIENMLANSKKSVLKGISLSGEQNEGFSTSYLFYLEGIAENVPQILVAIREELPGCIVEHKLVDTKAQGKRVMVSRFKTWIVITHDMQKRVNCAKTRDKWTNGICGIHDFCMLVILIFFAIAICISWYRHWNGYKDPWKNLIAFANY